MKPIVARRARARRFRLRATTVLIRVARTVPFVVVGMACANPSTGEWKTRASERSRIPAPVPEPAGEGADDWMRPGPDEDSCPTMDAGAGRVADEGQPLCLPVVAAYCGLAFECAVGQPQGRGWYAVSVDGSSDVQPPIGPPAVCMPAPQRSYHLIQISSVSGK